MKPGGGRAKGATGERELARLLEGWGAEIGIKLELSRNLEQTRNGGHDLTGLEGYGMAIEVKRVESNSINSWWDQAVRQGRKAGCIPVLAHRRNRQKWQFRIEAWVWPCGQMLAIDLTADSFKPWFQSQLRNFSCD